MAQAIYLDFNATAPLREEARAAMLAALDHFGNPSSVHAFGRRARRLVEQARLQVAALVEAAPAQVIFTAGATEANATVIMGSGRERVLASAIEHDSVLSAGPAVRVPVTGDGVVDLAALDRLLAADDRPALVSVMAANNETGVIQPVAEVAALAHRYGALVHCDAVQAAGKVPLALGTLGADLVSLSAHKLGGPQGVGALVVRDGLPVRPLLRGGGQERRRRAGTENVAGIAGFGAAARAAADSLSAFAGLATLRDHLEAQLLAAVPGACAFGAGAARVANTSCLLMPGVAAETQLMGFDLAGIAVSAGSACSSGKVTPSHVLLAMGASEAEAEETVRVSLGWTTTAQDVGRLIEVWQQIHQRATARTASSA
ncbi:MAG: cysteine desulfurase [Rhodospirillaceae bacterium]|nr:cysteine desulfurase [Rhodospirillaceae bacterium]